MRTTTTKIKQEFSIKAPATARVLLAGDFTDWQKNAIPLKPHGNGLWKITTTLSPGIHHCRFLMDADWQDDRECILRLPNSFGTQNAGRVVSSPTP